MTILAEVLDLAEEAIFGGKPRAPILRYPLDRQEDYGAIVEFMVYRTETDTADEDPKVVSAKSVHGEHGRY